ncbi:MAG: hypothetical protein LBP24_02740, partial [Coriobacteriales bacterium]|nr:hypothetical protein [Coriobacteriales bacterium]
MRAITGNNNKAPRQEAQQVQQQGGQQGEQPQELQETQGAQEPQQQPNQGSQQVERLGTAKISRLMVEFAIPSIIGLVVNGLYNIIDSIFMGHGVGSIGLATATIAMPIMIVGMAISILVGQGGNALTALRLGAGKHGEAEKVMGNTFTLTVIVSI